MAATVVDDIGRALDGIGRALDAALAVDLDEVFGGDDERLAEELAVLQREFARMEALRARLIARYDASRVWALDGSKSASAAVARDGSLSPGTARQLVARARQLSSMPVTAAALAAGAISVDHVDLLSRANQPWRNARFCDHEQMLVDNCTRLRYTPARRMLDYWCQHADAQGAETAADIIDHRRYATAATTWDGEVVVHAALPAVAGAAFTAELDRLERALYLDDKRSGWARTLRQRRADALVEMATRSRTAKPGGLKPRPLITILVGDDTFKRTCELADGTVITPGQIVPQLTDADIERIVFDGPTRIIATSTRRTFTGALRRAIEVRDRHCQHPCGCDDPAPHCDVDHIQPRRHGGQTSQDNGRLLCPTHNRHPDKRDPHRNGKRKQRPPPREP